MRPELILAIDQGTTGTTVLVVDPSLAVLGRGYQEIPQIYPRPGEVEHDPEAIWASVVGATAAALDNAGTTGASVAGIGITNQRETTILWERATGRAVANAIVWQDRRTANLCAELKQAGLEPRVREKTGLLFDPYFSGTKIRWLLDHVTGLRARAEKGLIAFGTVDTFLIWRLSGGAVHVTDGSNASRTLLFDLRERAFTDELCAMLGVPRAILPAVCPSAGDIAKTRGFPGLPDGVPITGVAGDQQAALFGQDCLTPGDVKCTYGTGAFVLMNVGDQPVASPSGLVLTASWSRSRRWSAGARKIRAAIANRLPGVVVPAEAWRKPWVVHSTPGRRRTGRARLPGNETSFAPPSPTALTPPLTTKRSSSVQEGSWRFRQGAFLHCVRSGIPRRSCQHACPRGSTRSGTTASGTHPSVSSPAGCARCCCSSAKTRSPSSRPPSLPHHQEATPATPRCPRSRKPDLVLVRRLTPDRSLRSSRNLHRPAITTRSTRSKPRNPPDCAPRMGGATRSFVQQRRSSLAPTAIARQNDPKPRPRAPPLPHNGTHPPRKTAILRPHAATSGRNLQRAHPPQNGSQPPPRSFTRVFVARPILGLQLPTPGAARHENS